MSQQRKVTSYDNVLSERLDLTSLTFQTLKSRSTQTAVSFVGKTGLTSCFVFAGVTDAEALKNTNKSSLNHSQKTFPVTFSKSQSEKLTGCFPFPRRGVF